LMTVMVEPFVLVDRCRHVNERSADVKRIHPHRLVGEAGRLAQPNEISRLQTLG
jgi:hypothetical protein